MQVFFNGQFVPEDQARVSVADRGFLYGDGLFELIPLFNGRPFRWAQHWARFADGAEVLKIRLPFPEEEVRRLASELVLKNRMPEALLRLSLSRGVGLRGYSPKGADSPVFVLTLHPPPGALDADPPPFKLITSSVRLPSNDSLAQFKHANKLPQILARAQADAAGADEALLVNSDGHLIEGTTSNFFWIEGAGLATPPLGGLLPGVTRAVVGEICRSLGLTISERSITAGQLGHRHPLFLSLSSWGIVAAQSLDGVALPQSPLVQAIRQAYRQWVRAETT